MIENFIKEYAKLIASDPDNITVSKGECEDEFCEITILASKTDAGKLIGKDGKMISAIKTVVSGCKAKDGKSYKVVVKVNEQR